MSAWEFDEDLGGTFAQDKASIGVPSDGPMPPAPGEPEDEGQE